MARRKQDPSLLELANFYSERNRNIFGDGRISDSSVDDTSLDEGFAGTAGRWKSKSVNNLLAIGARKEFMTKRKPPHHLPSLDKDHGISTIQGISEKREDRSSTGREGQVSKEKNKNQKKSRRANRPRSKNSNHLDGEEEYKTPKYVEKPVSSTSKQANSTPASVPEFENAQTSLGKGKNSNLLSRPKQRNYGRLTQRCLVRQEETENAQRPYGRRAPLLQGDSLPVESPLLVRRKGVCLHSDEFIQERTRARVVLKRFGEEEEKDRLFLPPIIGK